MSVVQRLHALVWLLWAPVLYASPVIQQSFEGVPIIAWLLACLLSTMGGVCAFMLQVVALMSTPIDPVKPPTPRPTTLVMLGTQMMCSWFAGSLVFLGCLHFAVPLYLNGVIVGAGSFGGAKTIEWVWHKIFKVEKPT